MFPLPLIGQPFPHLIGQSDRPDRPPTGDNQRNTRIQNRFQYVYLKIKYDYLISIRLIKKKIPFSTFSFISFFSLVLFIMMLLGQKWSPFFFLLLCYSLQGGRDDEDASTPPPNFVWGDIKKYEDGP